MQLGGTFFGTCSSAGSQTTKVVNDCLGFVLYTGASIYVRFTETNTGALSSLMLNVNNTGAKPIKRYGTTNLNTLDAITAGMVCNFVYDGSYWQWVGQMNTDTNTIPSAYCNTITSNPAKVAQCTDFVLRDNSYISIIFAQGNTSAGAFTLNINDTGAKQVYLNGHISGQSNYQFSAGSYILYYDGTAYQMRTDGLIHGTTTGNIINITNDGSTIYYMYGDGTTASFVMPHTQYTAGSAISISNNQITNTGVRAVGQGTENGTISVNTSGVTTNVAVKGLGSAAYENTNTFASASHTHGNISNLGYVTGNDTTISNGDSLLIADASDDDRLVKTTITFDGTTTNQFLTKAGTWAAAQTAGTYASSAGYATTAGHALDNTKLPLAGGTMTGGITLQADAAAYNNKGIIFTNGSRIGEDSSLLGIYGAKSIYIRPNSNTVDSVEGIILDSSSVYPDQNNVENLGKSDRKWKTVYATTFDGNATSATESQHSGSADYATSAVSASYATKANSAAYAVTASNAVNAASAAYAVSAASAGFATNAVHAASAAYAGNAGSAINDSSNRKIIDTYVTKEEFNTKLAATDAMQYKGTLGTGGTITALPATHSQGDSYKVITAGTYAGVNCEVGDLVICLTDGTAANDAHWTVVQTNLDGAVTGPASATDEQVALFSGTSGKVIKAATISKATAVTGATFNAGSVPTTEDLSVDDITAWTPNAIPTATVSNGVLIFYAGTTASLSYTGRTVKSVNSVGTAPSLSYATANFVSNIA